MSTRIHTNITDRKLLPVNKHESSDHAYQSTSVLSGLTVIYEAEQGICRRSHLFASIYVYREFEHRAFSTPKRILASPSLARKTILRALHGKTGFVHLSDYILSFSA